MSNLSVWWNELDIFRQVLYCVALPGTVALLIQTVLLVVGFADGGAGYDADFDADTDLDADGGEPGEMARAGIFTLQGIIAFVCVFGWGTLAFTDFWDNAPAALILGLALGYGAMWGIAKILMLTSRLAQSGTLKMSVLVGEVGTVYIPIPEAGGAGGKVNIETGGRLVELNAISKTAALPTNTRVKVVEIAKENTLVVEETL